MRHLPRRTDNALQQVIEDLDYLVLVERRREMVARALSQVSWRLYELRRGLAKEMRAGGSTWAEIGAVMGISRQSARKQWHTVDGELGITTDPYSAPSSVEGELGAPLFRPVASCPNCGPETPCSDHGGGLRLERS